MEKENPSAFDRSQAYDLPITSLDALLLSYRRLVGTFKAIKLGSCGKHPAYCLIFVTLVPTNLFKLSGRASLKFNS